MVDLNTLKEQIRSVNEQTRLVTDVNSKSVVQVPAEMWEDLISQVLEEPPSTVSEPDRLQALLKKWETEKTPQNERLKIALNYLDANPSEESSEWWDDFERF